MSVFDPLGFLANFLIYTKLLIQDLWRLNVDWDKPIPNEIDKKWSLWREELPRVEHFKIQRHYFAGFSHNIEVQIHTFVDASEEAFAAVTYFRIFDGQKVMVRFVSSKTRCSPMKQLLTIPRLELQSAVLGCHLCETVSSNHNMSISQRFYWSDSAVVISWIQSDHRRYKPFVAHRIAEILQRSKPAEWRWISTHQNIADKATRAKYPIKYQPCDEWIKGPSFLYESQSEWPRKVVDVLPESQDELKTTRVHNLHLIYGQVSSSLLDITNFSNYLRVVAWMRRFIRNKLNIGVRISSELTVDELYQADLTLCRLAQNDVYAEEIERLSQNKNVCKSSSIYKLSPTLDSHGVLRVNGRIDRCTQISEAAKNPIILPKSHYLTKLIVNYYHRKMYHQNANAIIAEIRQLYWIPHIKALVRKVKSECQLCRNRSAQPRPPLMGDLPVDRLSAYVRPFSYTGLDYFSPYHISIGRRREKRWVALFTCMTIRAVHMKVARDLSTDSCLLCIRNFVNRRGTPVRIMSDNGTNFVGASKIINEVVPSFDNNKILSKLAVLKIEWKMNCPENPHAGGAWERLVQSVKRVLSYTLVEEAPRLETFQSLLIEAENIVNSRPLTEISLVSDDD